VMPTVIHQVQTSSHYLLTSGEPPCLAVFGLFVLLLVHQFVVTLIQYKTGEVYFRLKA